MSDGLPNDWTDEDQNDLDRGKSSWDDGDGEWSEDVKDDPRSLRRLLHPAGI